MSIIIKSSKIRIYPNKEQQILISKHIGSCRFIWNYMLDIQTENYKQGNKYIPEFEMIKKLTPLKKQPEYVWLNEVSNTSLQKECRKLNQAYKSLFNKKNKHPKFKSKKLSKQAYQTRETRFRFISDKYVQIEKLGKVKYKTDLDMLDTRIKKIVSATISIVDNKYILSVSYEYENQVPKLKDMKVGIDLGIKELAVVSYDEEDSQVYNNINKTSKVRKLKRELKLLQRSISRKYRKQLVNGVFQTGKKLTKSKNIVREEKRLSKIQRKLVNIRHNYIHQTTNKIVSLLPTKVTMEDLNISGMMKNKHLSRSIQEQCWYEFIRQMKYKCEWKGIEFVQAARRFPSSKKCSCCGHIKKDLKLKDRVYVCSECGLTIDRDLNAAINLKNYVMV